MKFDGDRMSLMVHGENAKVISVETETLADGRAELRLSAVITKEQADMIANAWNGSFENEYIGASFNAGEVRTSREHQLRTIIRALRKRLAKESLEALAGIELEDIE